MQPFRHRATWSRRERYWTFFPQALWRAWAPRRAPGGVRLLDDVLWGQFCAFLAVRIHDDLLDAQARDGSLIFAADDLLLESLRAFDAHVPRPAFRALFDRRVRATLRAILEVDALQARPGAMTRAKLHLHARVSAVFTLGSAAVCLACRRPAMVGRVERACGHLAVAGQLVDDLTDVDEDLSRGRYNFVANVLGGGRPLPRAPRARERRVAEAILRHDAIGTVTGVIRRHVVRAARLLAPARNREIDDYLGAYLADIERIRLGAHRARVGRVFRIGRLA